LFLKASLFSTGGFSNLPSLHQDLLANAWAKEADFGQSIAIGQISPGPNGLWVISLGYLLDKGIHYQDAPDLFCLDLYKDFDIDTLAALAEPTKVTQKFVD